MLDLSKFPTLRLSRDGPDNDGIRGRHVWAHHPAHYAPRDLTDRSTTAVANTLKGVMGILWKRVGHLAQSPAAFAPLSEGAFKVFVLRNAHRIAPVCITSIGTARALHISGQMGRRHEPLPLYPPSGPNTEGRRRPFPFLPPAVNSYTESLRHGGGWNAFCRHL